MDLPRWTVTPVGDSWSWEDVPPLPPLVRAEDGSTPEQETRVRVAWDATALHVRFDCIDRHAWGTLTRRDDPLWQEEVVEVFLAPGEADPVDYLEFEVSPGGVLFDAKIYNPTSLRADLRADTSWDCPGLRWEAGAGTARQDWWAVLSLPWAGLIPHPPTPSPIALPSPGRGGATAQRHEGTRVGGSPSPGWGESGGRGGQGVRSEPPPPLWRANFYRIERPGDGPVEYSAWSPTHARPADFHRPAWFGFLELGRMR